MKIKNIGEFGLIGKIKKWIKHKDPSIIKGIGDDCAVIEFDRKRYMLFSSDMLIEGLDFTKDTSFYLIGRKAMGAVLSDIASKAGLPKYALVSLGLPKDTDLNFVNKLYKGFKFWMRRFNFEIVGGDISRADKLIIDISIIGFVEKENLILRNGARPKDIIFISGRLGNPNKQFYFTPRIREARYLIKNFKINSMIDISDGLLQDLNHILEESKVGAVIYEKLIPSRKNKDIQKILNRGEEFELLFTLPVKEARRLISLGNKLFYGIGQIVDYDYGLRLIDKHFKEIKIKARGFKHF
jgi:thiamine-monophosphate kinase